MTTQTVIETDLADALARLHTCQVADTLDSLGFRDQVLGPEVVPLATGTRAVGRAATLRFEATDEIPETDPYGDFIRYLDAVPEGSVAVIATDAPHRSGLWGELFSAAAQGHGVRGVVTDGCTRDSAQIRDLAFPAFSRGQRPVDYRGRQRIVESFGTVRCAGVDVANGDWVLADDDGVVVVPQDVALECFTIAAQRLRGESSVLDDLLGGAGLRQVWETYGLL